MTNDVIIAISAGLLSPKKDYSLVNYRNLYLNYGLLGLSSLIKKSGKQIIMLQGEFKSPENILKEITDIGINFNVQNVMVIVSVISFYNLQWAKQFISLINNYKSKVFLGGKYVLEYNQYWIENYFKGNNLTLGTEYDLFNKLEINDTEINHSLFKFDYSILSNYKIYNPSIEISRGCGYGCPFCADANRPKVANKNPTDIIKELSLIDMLYETNNYNVYFQSPNFNPSIVWIKLLATELKKLNHSIEWRCTTRVDVLKSNLIELLAKSGLKVLDLGLESASPKQLIHMNKTKDPSKYLKQADELLKSAYENGIYTKLNILIAAGETKDSIRQTIDWLSKREKYITGLSINCETIFGPKNKLMLSYKEKFGSSFVNNTDLIINGYAKINPSKKMDYDTATNYALIISKSFMTQNDYFRLKKFGYFARNYDYSDFLIDIMKSDNSKLPFEFEKKEI